MVVSAGNTNGHVRSNNVGYNGMHGGYGFGARNAVYALHSGKLEAEKEFFWNELFHLVSCIPQNEMVVLAGDMNGHVGSNNVGYDGTHGGYGFGATNADDSRILEFADGLNLVACNTLFTKHESKLVTYVAGSAKSTVEYIMARQG